MRGIVYTGQGAELVDGLEIGEPGPDEIVVRVEAAGVCHSDLSVVEGKFGGLVPTPFVMGHEGAGVVERVGDQVGTLAVGDHVVLSTIDSCGRCAVCTTGRPTLCQNSRLGRAIARRAAGGGDPAPGELPTPFRLDGTAICGFANTGVFAERVVVREVQAVAIDRRVPFTSACLIGCGVVTGTGAVFNRARVDRGDSTAVIGVGREKTAQTGDTIQWRLTQPGNVNASTHDIWLQAPGAPSAQYLGVSYETPVASAVVNQVGTYQFYCSIHGGLTPGGRTARSSSPRPTRARRSIRAPRGPIPTGRTRTTPATARCRSRTRPRRRPSSRRATTTRRCCRCSRSRPTRSARASRCAGTSPRPVSSPCA